MVYRHRYSIATHNAVAAGLLVGKGIRYLQKRYGPQVYDKELGKKVGAVTGATIGFLHNNLEGAYYGAKFGAMLGSGL